MAPKLRQSGLSVLGDLSWGTHLCVFYETTDDLLVVRSDAYVLTADSHVELAPERGERPPLVELDSRYYKILRDFELRFPAGPPSLVACERQPILGENIG